MAVDLYQLDRISRILKSKNVSFQSKKMMGGQVILVDEKMLMGLDQDKATGENRLMVRVGEIAYEDALKNVGARHMDFNGRPMKGFVFVYPEGFDLEEQLEYWINAAMVYNPIAKKSKK